MVKKIFEWPDKKIGFKFSMLAKGRAEINSGLPLSDLIHGLVRIEEVEESPGKTKQLLFETEKTVMHTLYFLHGAACSYAISKGQKEPNLDEVSDFLDELGQDVIMEMYINGLRTYYPKNEPAPETPGATVGQ